MRNHGSTDGKRVVALQKIQDFVEKTGKNKFSYLDVGVSIGMLTTLDADECIKKIGLNNRWQAVYTLLMRL